MKCVEKNIYILFFMHFIQDAFVTSTEFGTDLEHVEVLQKKFDEFQKVIKIIKFHITIFIDLYHQP